MEALFLEPARQRPALQFVIGGAQYPPDFPWTDNIFYWRHVAQGDHARFYATARATLNVTRASMAASGWCPSGRLFEAAACGAPILSDWWDGLDEFFDPRSEILIVRSTEDVLTALDLGDAELARIGEAGRQRTLADHTAERRAAELIALLSNTDAMSRTRDKARPRASLARRRNTNPMPRPPRQTHEVTSSSHCSPMSADRTSLCQRRASAALNQVVEKPEDYFSAWAGTRPGNRG